MLVGDATLGAEMVASGPPVTEATYDDGER